MKKNKGAVLTGVILMVLVMTLIGVPLLGMVVYNYRLVELSNSLKRSEYENEMAMDIISRIIRETVIEAISVGKDGATEGVNELAELQRSNYSAVYGKYTSLWINEYNLWESETNPDEDILGGFLEEIKNRSGKNSDSDIRNWWKGLNTQVKDSIKEAKRNEYVLVNVHEEMDAIQSDKFSEDENANIRTLLDDEGKMVEEKLNEAYNMIFMNSYREYIESNICGRILTRTDYLGIVENDNIDVSGTKVEDLVNVEGSIIYKETYLKIDKPVVRRKDGSSRIEVDVGTRFKKNKVTPVTTLSATFVIDTPGFDSVASVTQEAIPLSNPVLNQGGVVVGNKLILASGTTMQIANDLTVLGEKEDTAVFLNGGAKLVAKKPSGDVSNSRIAIAKDIVLIGNNELSTGNNPIYYRNLYVVQKEDYDSNDVTINFKGDAVAKDDLEINHEGKVTVTQVEGANYYGFNDTNDEGPDASSSIIVNANNNISNKTLTLGNLYLAGRAYIKGVEGTVNVLMTDDTGNVLKDAEGNIIYADTTYKTGESIAVKGNYTAYQTPLSDSVDFPYNNLVFSKYFMSREDDTEKQSTPIFLVDDFIKKPDDFKGSFDVNYKWKYFKEYAEKNSSILKPLMVNSSIQYIEGTAFDEFGNVVGSTNEKVADTSFRNNMAVEYEKYTKYFGYRPVDDTGAVTSNAKTSIFGTTNGWVKNFSESSKISDIEGGKYYQIYANGNKTVSLSGDINKGVIVCKGNLTLNVSSTATFSGVIIVGGDLTINGGKLILTDAKEEVISLIIGNYLGTNSDTTGETSELFNTFTYDESGSSYIVTEIGDNLININELIGITNWKKSSFGRL